MSHRKYLGTNEDEAREIDKASRALYAWFKSQDIDPGFSIPVMIHTLAIAISSIARDDDGIRQGARAVSGVLLEYLDAE